jgi:hypothetical protein
MANERARTARAELQAWYLHSLLPKLARAGRTGVVDERAIEALDAAVRALIDPSWGGREQAA